MTRRSASILSDQEFFLEMEFPVISRTGEGDTISFSSKSIESFESDLTNTDSR